MKNTVIEPPEQVLFGADSETRSFIASGYDLAPAQARLKLAMAALELFWTFHWAGPHDVVSYILEASAHDAGIGHEEFNRIIKAADHHAEQHHTCPGSLPASFNQLVYGRAVTV